MASFSSLTLAIYLALSTPIASGFSFTFTSEPKQCADLSLSISGAGSPPYSVLLIPYGPSPLPNNVEARTIVYEQFSGNSASTSFQLKFPASSQFVAVVSDSTGFGTGGTSVAATVMSSSDSSCYNSTQTVSPDFPFNISPPNQVVQCSTSRLWWDPSEVQGNVTFQGVIPGGESFSVPISPLTQVASEGTGFNWTPSVRAGTTLIIVAGDGRGLGTGGSGLYNVAAGLNPNSSCLTDSSPSSTAGSPAGGSYPTNTNGDQTSGGGGGGSSNIGAIVGGVIGVLCLIAIIVLGLCILRRRRRSPRERPVDLLHDDQDDDDHPPLADLPQYRPEPFLATEPTEVSTSVYDETGRLSVTGSRYGAFSVSDRPTSALSLSDIPSARSGTPDRETFGLHVPSGSIASTRKSPMPRQLRPVNIIQHEDAGPSEATEPEQPETIELPPAYTNIRKTS